MQTFTIGARVLYDGIARKPRGNLTRLFIDKQGFPRATMETDDGETITTFSAWIVPVVCLYVPRGAYFSRIHAHKYEPYEDQSKAIPEKVPLM